MCTPLLQLQGLELRQPFFGPDFSRSDPRQTDTKGAATTAENLDLPSPVISLAHSLPFGINKSISCEPRLVNSGSINSGLVDFPVKSLFLIYHL